MLRRNLNFTLLLTLQIFLCTGLEEKYKLLGRRCTDNGTCYVEQQDGSMRCIEGRCQCNTPHYILFLENDDRSNHDAGNARGCKDALTTRLKYLEGFHIICQDSPRGKICQCEDGMELYSSKIVVGGVCSSARRVGFGNHCRYSRYCNYEEGTRCKGEKCVCDWNDMYDFERSECVSKATYMEKNNISEYKVTHGVYCGSSDDCIEGLTCSWQNFSCTCPDECPYSERNQSCDCGEIVYETPYGPIIVGILVGFLIILCWWKVTKGAIKSHFKKKDHINEQEIENLNNQPGDGTHVSADTLPYNLIPAAHNANNPEQSTTVPDFVPTPANNPDPPEQSNKAPEYMPVPAFNPDYPEDPFKAPDFSGSHKDLSSSTALPTGYPLGFDLSSGPAALGNYPQPYPISPSAPAAPAFSATTSSLPYPLYSENPPTHPILTTEAPDIPMKAPPSYEETVNMKKDPL